MVGRRYGLEEIAGKLAQADELVAEGKSQQDISKALGISAMTYHRWRKLRNTATGSASDSMKLRQDQGELRKQQSREGGNEHGWRPGGDRRRMSASRLESATDVHGPDDSRQGTFDIDRLRELETENLRLRRLVTDLLLEKVGLEETLREGRGRHYRRARRD